MYTGKYLSLERSGIIGKSRDYNDYCCLWSSMGSDANSLILSRRGSNMAELFLEMTQWKNFMSAWVQILGSQNAWSTVIVKMTKKCCCCFFVYVPCMRFITYMFVYHFGLIWCFASIICKKGSFGNTASKAWKQQTRFYWVCSWEILAYATSLTSTSPELSASALK